MDRNNELHRKLVNEKSEANLKFIGKSIEQFYADEFDRIIEESEDTAVPESTRKKLSSMISEEQRRRRSEERKRKLVKFSKICAGVLAATVLSGALLISSVEAFRARVFEILFSERSDHVEFKPVELPYDVNGIIPAEWNGFWYPDRLPEGYVLSDFMENGQYVDLIYKNEKDDRIFFTQCPPDDLNLLVDNSEQNPERIEIASGKAFWTTSGERSMLMWLGGDMLFILDSSLSKEIMIEIAESVTYLKK